jgi:hypothetical protein
VEEAPGGRGRARPWRLGAAGHSYGWAYEDEERTRAATELERLFHERTYAKLQDWISQRHNFPAPWSAAGFATDNLAYLTADELEELGEEITAVLMRFRERTIDKAQRPTDARPVHLVAFGHPLPPTASGN